MKNKKLSYILAPAVILIWGMIVYKIFFAKEDQMIVPQYTTAISKKEHRTQIDTFNIEANYSDPFLRRTYIANPTKTSSEVNVSDYFYGPKPPTNTNTKKVSVKSTPLKWPAIRYEGLIINNKSGKKTGVLYIDNKSNLITEKTIINNLEVMLLTMDSVKIKFKDEDKVFFNGN